MAPGNGQNLRALIAQALERIDNHVMEDNRRFEDWHKWRGDFERKQDDKHRENQAALARAEQDASTSRRKVYEKLDELGDAITETRVTAAKSANKPLWAVIGALATLLLALAGATAYLADRQYTKEPQHKVEAAK